MIISGIDRKGTEIYEKSGKRQEMKENQEVGEEKGRKMHEAQPIANAVLQDYGIITKHNLREVITLANFVKNAKDGENSRGGKSTK